MTRHLRMASRSNKVEAGMNAVISHLSAVDSVLLLQIGIAAGLNVVQNGLPAISCPPVRSDIARPEMGTYLSSLLTKSPKPGVSTTVSLSLTPFSSMSAVVDLISTVWGTSAVNSAISLGGYSWVLNSVLTKVDFPRPDSP